MGMIVVDVGCAPQPRQSGPLAGTLDESLPQLVTRFHPDLLIGLDPSPVLEEGITCRGSTTVVIRRAAGWTTNGTAPFLHDGILSRITGVGHHDYVPTIDLAALVLALPQPVVLKLDVEGAEYGLVRHLHEHEADSHLDLLLVEWHKEVPVEIVAALRCPWEPW